MYRRRRRAWCSDNNMRSTLKPVEMLIDFNKLPLEINTGVTRVEEIFKIMKTPSLTHTHRYESTERLLKSS